MKENYSLLKTHPAWVELLLSSTFINLLSLALPFTLLQIYDRILPNQGYGTASVLASAVAIAILLELLLRYSRSWVLASSAANFELKTTTRVVSALMQSDYHHVENLGTGKVSNGLSSIAAMREIYSGQALVALMDFPFVLIFLSLVAYIGGPLVFIPLALWGLIGGLVYIIGKKLTQATQELALTDSERSRMLILVLSGLTTAKALAMETRLASTYNEINYRRLGQQQQVDWLSSKLQELIQGASQATTLLIVLIGCLEVLNGTLTTGGLAACSILAGRAIAPLGAIISLKSRLAQAKTAMSHVESLTQLPQESFKGSKQYQQKLPLGPIKFDAVCSQQVGAKIDQFTLEIPAGSLVTVTSDPLTHASLLLSVVGAFHHVEQGCIDIDGVAQDDHSATEYRQSVTYVPPWPTLFAGSLLENMTMFRAEKEALAMELAELVGLTTSIAKLPAGYQTEVGVSDSQLLNKGAIKLIAIVRALVQSPSILLLDEPMISLDADSQARVVNLIKQYQGRCTIICASHFAALAKISSLRVNIKANGNAEVLANLPE
ncbi:ABC transporter transmembrane domain-containing protein [Shewanella fidelis]|uniref:ABC transporter transmembrane domain-containing protein n=1 Tax=Shewanella fidelis TaxID=173509 RepID=A0AAW8NR41_9GAMM|nr:ABC transporter transmembrane domain-containing protein [Shewanella fidelis]MDR8525250.1 ABC transporter transmembrane domain-containing protein [Shewanella fidelis]MDW4811321.1 ABC transporter transmembrane domain-containing protein [Shewanella fidelis]MDW4814900.1 ABC transporter transmembrane domain-containing protein [Shewanella fidelis]MDW4818990.1 ABC transporter transmembrane domain-containing protein [Shewanella fidelis]MDW4823333.1 ABC transporter transmembrane domain-containing pr